jgi:hypothetical protein
MAVKEPNTFTHESGQSVLEFLIMVPLLLGFVIILVRTNTVIQMSIVDQQYARAQVLFLAFNSASYPQVDRQANLASAGINQMTLGVSDNSPANGTEDYVPKASTYGISRDPNRTIADDATPQDTPAQRIQVRVRNTATLCTPSLYLKNAGGAGGSTTPAPLPGALTSELKSSQAFDYCGSTIQYEQ